ncbi:MAG: signal peptide peptidase SppA [Clostridia bacterium]|nr:signal peptide peptidase SppA [Clostridia bacterium]
MNNFDSDNIRFTGPGSGMNGSEDRDDGRANGNADFQQQTSWQEWQKFQEFQEWQAMYGSRSMNCAYAAEIKRKKKWKPVKILAGLVILLMIVYVIMSSIQYGMFGSRTAGTAYTSGPYVGVLHVEGTMSSSTSSGSEYSQSYILNQIAGMESDPANRGIMLYINSPGGEAYCADEIYLKLKEYKETTKRPVYSYFANTAASAAYYIAAISDKIYANRGTVTGSIGVYMGPVVNAAGLFEKVGISGEYIKSAQNKAMGNYFDPITDEQRAIMQSEVDEIFNRFVSIVAEGRGLTEETTRILSDGRPYTAGQALNNGLIDGICQYDEAKQAMLSDEDIDAPFVKFKYQKKTTLSDIIAQSTDKLAGALSASNLSDVEAAVKMLEERPASVPMMLAE